MIIYPAIDLRGGKVVRLRGGDPQHQITFSDDPLATARRWQEAGATWLHVVNLDGALAQANDNSAIVAQIARLGLKVQFGGGLRSLDDVRLALESGVARAVMGTLAVQQPQIVAEAVACWGVDAICVGLDAREGKVATHGWQQLSAMTPVELGRLLYGNGARHALYTDVSRDGGLEGVNVEATVQLAQATGLHVIASGGVSRLGDVRRLAESRAVAGVVIGMALYEGRFTLQEAIEIARSSAQPESD